MRGFPGGTFGVQVATVHDWDLVTNMADFATTYSNDLAVLCQQNHSFSMSVILTNLYLN